jgi:hypothetical protein
LRQGWRVRMLRLGPVCRRLSEQDGSGRRAACHQRCLHDQRSHSPAAISRLRSGKRSRSSTRRAARCRRSLAGSGGRHRRSPESCGGTLPGEAVAWRIARQRRNGTPSVPLVAPSRRSLRATRHCEPMWRNDWLATSWRRAGLLFPGRRCAGRAVGMGRGRTGDGRTPGARSRSPAACRSTSRTMRPCASAMKPSTRRCSCKGGVHCAAS